ncbi:pentapeptide repeat-containing protein [Desulfovibrio ferrophilus]|uniref:Pentapeptide repeat-containing protein n=1 Tax=Desulfovibrio ferrophilus TaxID=241368 RepID=A0A2Z6AZ84_9BACT|nr:pentapeptide repeat-containing protein [Desulfovibrio ferrophilus]BBD08466.1 pentapeptide repeat-containing protein [Desulfovibrio ferrophilus]
MLSSLYDKYNLFATWCINFDLMFYISNVKRFYFLYYSRIKRFCASNKELVFIFIALIVVTFSISLKNYLNDQSFFSGVKVEMHGAILEFFIFGIVFHILSERKKKNESIDSIRVKMDVCKEVYTPYSHSGLVNCFDELCRLKVKGFNLDCIEIVKLSLCNKDINEVSFVKSDMCGCRFCAAKFIDSSFSGSVLIECSFVLSKMRGGDFDDCLIVDSDFSKSVINGASFCNSLLVDVDFEGAELREVDFCGAELRGIDFSKCVYFDVDSVSSAILVDCIGV